MQTPVEPLEEIRDLNIGVLQVVVDITQLRGLPVTPCPWCGEKALMVDIIEPMMRNSPAYRDDAETQHYDLRRGHFWFGGTYQIACTECDYGTEEFIQGSGQVFSESEEDDDFLIMS